ncbi:MAG: hypothetical protein JSV65_06455 [Armatimonadota bacterium]|nr:MAG: hypothetical protein JSV65_06455 [Armatimonadota bacterium]
MVCSLLISGCGGKSESTQAGIVLGPKPATYVSEPSKNQMVDSGRAWLESLGEADVKALDETGELAFSFEALQKSDPAHAEMVEAYVNDMQARIAAKLEAKGLAPPMLTLRGISFRKQAPGAYEIGFRFADDSVSNLILSEPLPSR